MESYDLIAIGAGPAGESATELAAFFGHRCLIIERDRPGGCVTTTGGAPTKTLREAAMYFTGYTDRDTYGVSLNAPPELVLGALQRRTLDVCKILQKVTSDNIASRGIDYVQGAAKFGTKGNVFVTLPDGSVREFQSKCILIATGSRPIRPANVPFDLRGVCDTDTVLQRGWLPKDIVIVGGGPVAVEFATISHALGAKVTLVTRSDRLLAMMDEEVSGRLTGQFENSGVTVLYGSTTREVAARDDKLEVKLSSGVVVHPDTLLFAAGRASNTEGLELQQIGVQLDAKGRIQVDEHFKTNAEGVYAAGDVLGPTLASVAMEQGRIAVCHAFNIPFEGIVDPVPVSAVYGMPEVAKVGLTEEECKELKLDYEIGRSELALTPRGAIAGRDGLLKIIFLRADRKIVGVHCISDIASELVGIGQMAIRCGATLNTIANMSMNTPTYSYAYKYAAFDGLRRLAKGTWAAAYLSEKK